MCWASITRREWDRKTNLKGVEQSNARLLDVRRQRSICEDSQAIPYWGNRARRVLMTHPLWMEASLEGPIPGCVRLQICGVLARFCRDLQNYLVDIVDVTMSPVQFKNTHWATTFQHTISQSRQLSYKKL